MQRTSDGRVLTPEEREAEAERLRIEAENYRVAQSRNKRRRVARRAEREATGDWGIAVSRIIIQPKPSTRLAATNFAWGLS